MIISTIRSDDPEDDECSGGAGRREGMDFGY
jgi:hypothetical protein